MDKAAAALQQQRRQYTEQQQRQQYLQQNQQRQYLMEQQISSSASCIACHSDLVIW